MKVQINPLNGEKKKKKKILYTSFKPVFKCKQVENNNLIFLYRPIRLKFSKRKTTFFLEFWKLGAVYFCTVKTFYSFQKLWAGDGGQPNNFF